jgi:hypothetical protein
MIKHIINATFKFVMALMVATFVILIMYGIFIGYNYLITNYPDQTGVVCFVIAFLIVLGWFWKYFYDREVEKDVEKKWKKMMEEHPEYKPTEHRPWNRP